MTDEGDNNGQEASNLPKAKENSMPTSKCLAQTEIHSLSNNIPKDDVVSRRHFQSQPFKCTDLHHYTTTTGPPTNFIVGDRFIGVGGPIKLELGGEKNNSPHLKPPLPGTSNHGRIELGLVESWIEHMDEFLYEPDQPKQPKPPDRRSSQ